MIENGSHGIVLAPVPGCWKCILQVKEAQSSRMMRVMADNGPLFTVTVSIHIKWMYTRMKRETPRQTELPESTELVNIRSRRVAIVAIAVVIFRIK